jgi:hypothetical protein
MYKFKIGDKVKVKFFCSGAYLDTLYSLIKTTNGALKTWAEGQEESCGCTCKDNWILVSPKIIKEFGIVAFMKGIVK